MAERTCTVEGCIVADYCRGYCEAHYCRWRRYGDDFDRAPIKKRLPPGPCKVEGCERPRRAAGMCTKHYDVVRAQRHPERNAEQARRWRTANRERAKAYRAAYRSTHLEQEKRLAKERYQANRPEQLRAVSEWQRRNPGYDKRRRARRPEHYALQNREKARRRRQGPPVSYPAILAEHGMTCHICGGEIASLSDLHMDHVVPLVHDGPHSAENIRPAHARCNLRKGARIV